jgi:hypothetical protein
MVGSVSKAAHDNKQDKICVVMFGLVYRSKFSNFAESSPIEMVGPVPETVQGGKQDPICSIMFDLI